MTRNPGDRLRDPWMVVGHAAAGTVVLVGLVATLVRPTAVPIGPVLALGDWFEPAVLARSAVYRDPRHWVLLARLIAEIGVVLAMVATPVGRRVTQRIVARVGQERPARAAATVTGTLLAMISLAGWPFAYYLGFIREGQFGFRTHGFAGWMGDWLVAHVPVWLIGAGAAALVYWVVGKLPRSWPPVVSLTGGALAVAGVFAAPVIMEPLQFNFERLDNAEVESAVARVVDNADFPIDEFLVADASRRTTKHNAYVSGIGPSKRLVLYDTLIDDADPDVVALIVAHELGHVRNADVLRGTLLGVAGLTVAVYLLAWFVRWRVGRGLQDRQADPQSAAVIVAAVIVLVTLSQPVQMAVTRQLEHAADQASLELTGRGDVYLDLHTGLAEQNLGAYNTPAWARVLWGTHPTAAERITRGVEWEARDP